MSKSFQERLQNIQERVDKALKQFPEDVELSDFSEYMPDHTPEIIRELEQAAREGGLEGIEAAMDQFGRLEKVEDKVRLQYALTIFLSNDADFSANGLRLPSLEERSSWKILPSRRPRQE